jgi:peptide/nickel transport system permease protein
MFNFIIRHIFGALLSLWIISLLIFFLSKAVPGDPVVGLKEINEGSYHLDYEKEYKQKATAFGLDLPTFYFSMVPRNFPKNLNEVMPYEKKNFTKALLFQGYQYNDILSYEAALELFLDDEAAREIRSNLKIDEIRSRTDLVLIQKELIENQEISGDRQDFVTLTELSKAIDKLVRNKTESTFPVFYWHGFKNQYHQWITSLLKGKPGNSRIDGKPVAKKISRALVWTVFLILTAIIFSYGLGIMLGLLLAGLEKQWLRRWIEKLFFGIYAIPVFWLATLLLVFFTTKEYGAWTNIFPSVGLVPIDTGAPWYSRLADFGKQLILPCFILVIHNLAFVSTLVKRNIESYKDSGFVLMARAYGFKKREILWREIFPHTLLPIITSITSAIPTAITGSLVIEIIFNIPGVGRLLFSSINLGDWPVVFAVVMLIALVTIISFFTAEILYRWADPRIKQQI